jgi:hypothetical protein
MEDVEANTHHVVRSELRRIARRFIKTAENAGGPCRNASCPVCRAANAGWLSYFI